MRGLSSVEADERLRKFGRNLLPEKRGEPLWLRFLHQFRSPLIYILLFALAADLTIWFIEGAAGFPVESVAIGLILLLNAGLGVYQEHKAEAALARLRAIATPLVWVFRDDRLVHLPSTELVPGDVVRIEAGDRVPADGILTDAQNLTIDESVLTGESVPVEKADGDEVFSGTLLLRGVTYAEIRRTGEHSAMGRLAAMISAIEASKTPLEVRLDKFGRQISAVVLGLAVFLVVAGTWIEGIDRLGHVLLFAVALAVAAVPEGLPAVLTLTLSLGVERMAKSKAVVRRLSAVEALGSVTVIATDKTGTLTENRMSVREVHFADETAAVRAMILANDAELGADIGDPVDLALLHYAAACDIDAAALRLRHPRISVRAFDSRDKFMRATTKDGDSTRSYLKGAPEVILGGCELPEEARREWEELAETHAARGLRVLALATREGEGDDLLEFCGLVLLGDPPRPEVPDAIREALRAGIRIVMITGDHPATAAAIADEVGIPHGDVLTGSQIERLDAAQLRSAVGRASVFARVAPEQKLKLVEALQSRGEVVAVTGDGVNDAPALKRSDVGVAMGQRGSDVSREVADLVLLDDNFATIVTAIEEGRSIYENIQKFIRFLFSTNLALILLVVGGAIGSFVLGLQDVAGGLLLPLTAVQLLWINIIADGPPALALGFDKNDGVMSRRPRPPSSPLLDRDSLRFIFFAGFVKAGAGGFLLFVLPFLGYPASATRTAVFHFESLAQLFFAYPSRHVSVVPRVNPSLHAAVAFGIALQILVMYVPYFRDLMGLTPVDAKTGMIMVATILATWGIAEAYSWLVLKSGRERNETVPPRGAN